MQHNNGKQNLQNFVLRLYLPTKITVVTDNWKSGRCEALSFIPVPMYICHFLSKDIFSLLMLDWFDIGLKYYQGTVLPLFRCFFVYFLFDKTFIDLCPVKFSLKNSQLEYVGLMMYLVLSNLRISCNISPLSICHMSTYGCRDIDWISVILWASMSQGQVFSLLMQFFLLHLNCLTLSHVGSNAVCEFNKIQ